MLIVIVWFDCYSGFADSGGWFWLWVVDYCLACAEVVCVMSLRLWFDIEFGTWCVAFRRVWTVGCVVLWVWAACVVV